MLRLALTPRWLAGLGVVLVLVAVFVTLSTWQVSRAEHKNDVTVAADSQTLKDFNDVMSAQVPMPGTLVQQRVRLTGEFLPDDQVVVVDRSLDGRDGYWVVTMFKPDGARLGGDSGLQAGTKPIAIPVLRGWTADREAAHASRAPQGTITFNAAVNSIEAPAPTKGLPEGEVGSVSTSQLVNLFNVYSYSGYLYPDAQAASTVGAGGLVHVPLAKATGGGVDLQSAAYAVEWILFAGFALYIWWRLLRDEFLKRRAAAQAPGDDELVVVKQAGERHLRMDHAQSAEDRRHTDASPKDSSSDD